MTENKRFTITQDFEEHHRQIRDNGHIIMGCFIEPQAEVIVDFLNQLNDENEKLKSYTGEMEDYLASLEEKNEQLKSRIKEVTELLSEEVDLFSEKATEHDMNAYVELNQLDNKDAYYMATATKKAIKILKGCLND